MLTALWHLPPTQTDFLRKSVTSPREDFLGRLSPRRRSPRKSVSSTREDFRRDDFLGRTLRGGTDSLILISANHGWNRPREQFVSEVNPVAAPWSGRRVVRRLRIVVPVARAGRTLNQRDEPRVLQRVRLRRAIDMAVGDVRGIPKGRPINPPLPTPRCCPKSPDSAHAEAPESPVAASGRSAIPRC